MSANQFEKKSEAWSALFSEPTSELVQRYTASVAFDQRLWRADIAGSLAHATMLADRGVIGAADLADIRRGLAQVAEEIDSGRFQWRIDLEDVHLNIEARLVELVGDAGKRLHTGRSRNDQVATDVRLWLRDEIELIGALLGDLQRRLVALASSTPRPSCPASRTCRSRSRCRSRTTCSPMSRCSPATASAWSACTRARTGCRSAPLRSPAPASRSIAKPSPARSAWKAFARTASMR
jgi:hypothetical protein